MLTHHNWWSTHYECYAALCQNWGWSAGTTSILTNREVRDPHRKKTALSGGKTEKNLSQFFLRLANTYKKYILQKNWVKTVIPALSSGRSNLQRPIWGCHRQLDDRDHLVGQLTRGSPIPKSICQNSYQKVNILMKTKDAPKDLKCRIIHTFFFLTGINLRSS